MGDVFDTPLAGQPRREFDAVLVEIMWWTQRTRQEIDAATIAVWREEFAEHQVPPSMLRDAMKLALRDAGTGYCGLNHILVAAKELRRQRLEPLAALPCPPGLTTNQMQAYQTSLLQAVLHGGLSPEQANSAVCERLGVMLPSGPTRPLPELPMKTVTDAVLVNAQG